MRCYHGDPDNVYILVRVFNIEDGHGGVKIFPDTWSFYLGDVLDFRSKDGYEVFGGSGSNDINL